ncbi:MAG TPA: SGNH/GDSL hydrolase family protein [Gemmataceae bacterium]|jgi:hypothetical protein
MGHIVLLGDSIFDNERYVPDRPPVIEQLRRSLPPGWRASLLAVDGDVVGDVSAQLERLPHDATHLFVSVGGNDALGEITILGESVSSVGDALELLRDVQVRFHDAYRKMLRTLCAVGKPTAVCTIYDAIPGLSLAELAALAVFNDVILREAFQAGVPVIDLRLLCDQPGDYSPLSSIEPSLAGGSKIARAIAELATSHDFGSRKTVIYL